MNSELFYGPIINRPQINNLPYTSGTNDLMKKVLVLEFLLALGLAAQTSPIEAVIEAAHTNSLAFKDLLTNVAHNLKTQGAALVWGQDFLFAVETEKQPSIAVDGLPGAAMSRIEGSNIWYRVMKMRTGVTHAYEFHADGKT